MVRPLFEPEDLVQQRLVKLGGEEVVSCLNAALALKEETRRADFRGSRVAVAEYGMLVEDMRQSMHRFLLPFTAHATPPCIHARPQPTTHNPQPTSPKQAQNNSQPTI